MCWTTPVFWPDFGTAHLQEALDAYATMQMHACTVPE
jgi:undecaprenyl pyrophosphate synthase